MGKNLQFFIQIMYPPIPGPARAHGKSIFLGRQVMFVLEKLGLMQEHVMFC